MAKGEDQNRDRSFNRRAFFRDGLRELLRPLADAAEKKARPVAEVARQLRALEQPPAAPSSSTPSPSPFTADPTRPLGQPTPEYDPLAEPAPVPPLPAPFWLRPPGALDEDQFKNQCSRCGDCARVCPAQCIKIDPTGTYGDSVPYIEVDSMPCVVCSGLECMSICPSGALIPTPVPEIDMGTAVWHPDRCLRSQGQECTACVDHCPLGCDAIDLQNGQIVVFEEGCIGCGACEYYCPTIPKSIVIVPKAARAN